MAAIIALCALISVHFLAFVAPENLGNVFNDTSPVILLAMGQMVVILTKCIDLSVAANLALYRYVCLAQLHSTPNLLLKASFPVNKGTRT